MIRVKSVYSNLFVLAIITISMVSCSYKEVQLKKIESFKVLHFDKEGAEVELNLLVDNKNKFGFTVYSSDLNLTISKIELGKVTFAEKVHIPGSGECHKRVVLKASLKDLGVTALASLASLAFTKQVDLSINGDVKVRSMLFFSKRYPINLKEKIKF